MSDFNKCLSYRCDACKHGCFDACKHGCFGDSFRSARDGRFWRIKQHLKCTTPNVYIYIQVLFAVCLLSHCVGWYDCIFAFLIMSYVL